MHFLTNSVRLGINLGHFCFVLFYYGCISSFRLDLSIFYSLYICDHHWRNPLILEDQDDRSLD